MLSLIDGMWRYVNLLIWTPVQLLVLLVLYVAYCLARLRVVAANDSAWSCAA